MSSCHHVIIVTPLWKEYHIVPTTGSIMKQQRVQARASRRSGSCSSSSSATSDQGMCPWTASRLPLCTSRSVSVDHDIATAFSYTHKLTLYLQPPHLTPSMALLHTLTSTLTLDTHCPQFSLLTSHLFSHLTLSMLTPHISHPQFSHLPPRSHSLLPHPYTRSTTPSILTLKHSPHSYTVLFLPPVLWWCHSWSVPSQPREAPEACCPQNPVPGGRLWNRSHHVSGLSVCILVCLVQSV